MGCWLPAGTRRRPVLGACSRPAHRPGRIIVKRSQLQSLADFAGTVLHELSHALSDAPDMSLEFERQLTEELARSACENPSASSASMIPRRSRASSIARVFVQKFTSRFRAHAGRFQGLGCRVRPIARRAQAQVVIRFLNPAAIRSAPSDQLFLTVGLQRASAYLVLEFAAQW